MGRVSRRVGRSSDLDERVENLVREYFRSGIASGALRPVEQTDAEKQLGFRRVVRHLRLRDEAQKKHPGGGEPKG